jgi:outer membrane receptor protein involved in Fe transport
LRYISGIARRLPQLAAGSWRLESNRRIATGMDPASEAPADCRKKSTIHGGGMKGLKSPENIGPRLGLAVFTFSAACATTVPVRADTAQAAAVGSPTPLELPAVEVVGVTPSSSLGLPLDKVPGNVQSSRSEDINRHQALDLSSYMNRSLGSVNINDDQNNTFQPDVTYRGFDASPLLGTPIGLSVFQDGVRVNEPFGDIVNWDLIPKSAISSIDLIPGSNPLFGLNALGGSLSVRTKSGFAYPGTSATITGGSFGRASVEMEHGGSRGNFDWFVTGNVAHEDGWRVDSKSDVHQAFGKVGWQNQVSDIDLSYTFADNALHGVGPTPLSQLSVDRNAIYTVPDNTKNALHFFNLQASHQINDAWELSGNAYYRQNNTDTLNSNTGNPNNDCTLFAGFNQVACLDSNNNLIAAPPASNQITHSDQYTTGVTAQASNDAKLFNRDNNLAFGASYDFGHTRFTEYNQDAVISPGRATVGIATPTLANDLIAENEYIGVFATDTLSIASWLHVTAAGRWTQAKLSLRDQTGLDPALNGNDTFDRFNPSAGFTLDPFAALSLKPLMKEFTFFVNYNEGFRAPSPIELTCADPNAPCTLPSAIVSDPPLKPVVAKTWEVGFRGKLNNQVRWNISGYRTELDNDILFVNAPSGGLNTGFFQNVGQTRRQGVEVNLQGQWQRLDWYANYSFIDATYQSAAVLQNAIGPETVKPGDRIPGIPQNTFKLGLEYEVLPKWHFGGNLLYASSQFVRGDDNNRLPQVPEYAVVNLDTRYQFTKHVEIFGMVNNIFDTNYETFGVLTQNYFTGQDERFLGPGAPIAGWAGVKLTF